MVTGPQPPAGYPLPPGYPPPPVDAVPPKRRNGFGLVALIAAVIISVVVVGVTVFANVVAGNDPWPSAETRTDGVPTRSDDPGFIAAPRGTRDNPLPIGEVVTDSGWTVKLGTPREAGAEIAVEDRSKALPEPGMEFWIVPVQATYTGEDPVMPALDIWVDFVGSDNRTYDDDECGDIPDSLIDVGELHTGGVADANTCVAVPAGADGLWALTIAVFSDPVYFIAE